MPSIATDAIGGFNALLAAQRREPGVGPGPGSATTRLTLVLFDGQYEVPYKSIPLIEVPDLTDKTFLPRGSTALRDAIGRTLSKMTRSFAARAGIGQPAAPEPTNYLVHCCQPGALLPVIRSRPAQPPDAISGCPGFGPAREDRERPRLRDPAPGTNAA